MAEVRTSSGDKMKALLYAAAGFLLVTSSTISNANELPELPPAPHLNTSKYPNCQKEWITTAGADKTGKMQLINSCINALEQFNQFQLKGFTRSVTSFSTTINVLEANFSRSKASADDKKAFKAKVQDAIANFRSADSQGNNYGEGYSDYYSYFYEYQDDVKLLSASWRNLNNS